MKEAQFYQKKDEQLVQCLLCPHNCIIPSGKRGKCGVRENKKGVLYSLVFAKAIAANIDPIEKKPLFHFLPGSQTFSFATVGCNLSCDFCQNWEISQNPKPDKKILGQDLTPQTIVKKALDNNCQSISYTYTEPTIFFEYAYETAKLAKEQGLKNVFVSNGFINPEPIRRISTYLDAVNIDLKGSTEEFYKKTCQGSLNPVLRAIEEYYKNEVFLEITSLIIPGHNDSEEMIRKTARFIVKIDKNIPWHLSRFFPRYKRADTPATDRKTIFRAMEIGKEEGIKYIYPGNI